MNTPLLILAALFILIYGGLAVVAVRMPLLSRLAVREALRRPGQAFLLLIGLMIASASMMAGLVIGDSSEATSAALVQRGWGRVDLTVTAGGQLFSADVANRIAREPAVRREAAAVQAGVETVTSVSDIDQRLGRTTVRLLGFDPAAQPAFGAYVLTNGARTFGQDLAVDQLLLSSNLADALQARIGDRLQIGRASAGSAPSQMVVAGIAKPQGPGAYGLVPAIFTRLDTAQQLLRTDQINVVRISAHGEGDAEAASAHRLAVALTPSVAAMSDAAGAQIREVKATDLSIARRTGDNNRGFFLSISFLVVVAASALAVNLAIALADERRPRLAVLRALGLTRRRLIMASLLEGALFSAGAAVLSIGPGIAAGILVTQGFRHLRQGALLEAQFDLTTTVKPETVIAAIIAGALVTIATLFIASLRTSRMTIVAAIRDLPDDRVPTRGVLRRISLALLAAVALAGMLVNSNPVRVIAGSALIAVAVMAFARILSDRVRATLMGAGFASWAFAVTASNRGNDFPVVAVLVEVIGLCLLVVANLTLAESVLRFFAGASGKLNAVFRPPLAYLGRRPLRTGLATGAFGVILTIIALFAMLVGSQRAYARDAFSYDLQVISDRPLVQNVASTQGSAITGSVAIDTRIYSGPMMSSTPTAATENSIIKLYAFGTDELTHPPVPLFGRDTHFSSDAAVWAAVAQDSGWIVSDLVNPGQTITLVGDHGPVHWRVAAQQMPTTLDGVIGSRQAMADFASRPAATTVLLRLRSGTDAGQAGRDIQRAAFPTTVDTVPAASLRYEYQQAFNAFVSTATFLISMGLVAGVLTIGIVTLRAVVERRHAIGVLRALGYQRRDVVNGLVAEAALNTTIGVVIGLLAGILFGLIALSYLLPEGRYAIDFGTIASTLAIMYGSLLLVTIAPAIRASRLAPAQALRITE